MLESNRKGIYSILAVSKDDRMIKNLGTDPQGYLGVKLATLIHFNGK